MNSARDSFFPRFIFKVYACPLLFAPRNEMTHKVLLQLLEGSNATWCEPAEQFLGIPFCSYWLELAISGIVNILHVHLSFVDPAMFLWVRGPIIPIQVGCLHLPQSWGVHNFLTERYGERWHTRTSSHS